MTHPNIPAGWVLVPVEPTEEMIASAIISWHDRPDKRRKTTGDYARDDWAAMLNAAPKAPVAAEPRKILAHDLAGMLVFGGFMGAAAQDDPEGFDNYRTMEKVGYLADLLNASIAAPKAPCQGDPGECAFNGACMYACGGTLETSVHQVKSDSTPLPLEAAGAAARLPLAPFNIALDTRHEFCHQAADAFWNYWKENGETHKHGYYESTWGAINRALRMVGTREHDWGDVFGNGATKYPRPAALNAASAASPQAAAGSPEAQPSEPNEVVSAASPQGSATAVDHVECEDCGVYFHCHACGSNKPEIVYAPLDAAAQRPIAAAGPSEPQDK